MTAKIIDLPMETTLDIPPDKVLMGALGRLESVVICGFGKDGEFFSSSSLAYRPDILYILERCKRNLMMYDDEP